MNIENKICIITGATSGIGKETATHLSKLGVQLVLPSRNISKANIIAKEISNISGNNKITILPCDLESLDSIKAFATSFKEQFNHLDILINNAGVWFSHKELTKDGFEKNFAVNYLSHFFLTNLLLDVIKGTPNSRIISVSIEAHRFTNINFDNLQSEKYFNNFIAYGQSKLANILFTKKLAEILKDYKITVNCLHPGIVATNLFNKLSTFSKGIFELFMISPEMGAATSIYLATSDDVKNISGAYFKKKKVSKSTSFSNNKEAADKLWEVSLKLVGLKG